MRFLRKWILKWAEKNRDCKEMQVARINETQARLKDNMPEGITFNVVPASGGVVITINKYDRQKGYNIEHVHVIHDDQDVATNIGHIVSIELLRAQ